MYMRKDNSMSRKTIAAVLAVMIFITSGCANIQVKIQGSRKMSENEPVAVSSEEDNRAVNSEIGGGKPWIDSDIKENISADTPVDPKDDFHLYVNKEWILKNEIPDGYFVWSPYHERTLEVKNQCIDLLTDDSLTGHDAELIQTYNSLILDWDARNASGVSGIQELYFSILQMFETTRIRLVVAQSNDANGTRTSAGRLGCTKFAAAIPSGFSAKHDTRSDFLAARSCPTFRAASSTPSPVMSAERRIASASGI